MLNLRITDADFYKNSQVEYLSNAGRYGARGVVQNEEGQVILMYMASKNRYKLPGGGIEPEETREEAFKREVLEETGYGCEIISYLGTVDEHKCRNNFRQQSYCFYAKTVGQRQKTHLTPKEEQLGFTMLCFTIEDAINIMKKTMEEDNEYGMKFMLKRDLTILEYVKGALNNE